MRHRIQPELLDALPGPKPMSDDVRELRELRYGGRRD